VAFESQLLRKFTRHVIVPPAFGNPSLEKIFCSRRRDSLMNTEVTPNDDTLAALRRALKPKKK
jgi:hypothetical protein